MNRTIADHVENLRDKPHHVRHRLAFGISAGITGLVAVGWFAATASSGVLALKSSTDTSGAALNIAQATEDTKTNFTQLVGAASAAFGATTTAPALTIVDMKASSTLDAPSGNRTDKTVITF